jgi:hypothetical protein
MNRWRVKLSQTELMIAAYVGSARNVQSLTRDWKPGAGAGVLNTWTLNIEGAGGEMAAAKALNIYWLPVIGDPDANDVGPYQVRTNISRQYDDLCLRPRDRPGRIFIGVLSFCPEFEICGWILGQDGKREEWLRDGTPGRPPCYYVPRSALAPMETLPPSPSPFSCVS